MTKKWIAVLLCLAVLACSGCSLWSPGTSEDETSTVTEDNYAASLPAFEYTGVNPYMQAINKAIVETFGAYYEQGEDIVCIPAPVILAVDGSDMSDVKVWGNFWILNYKLNNTTLETVSGGEYPGVIHLAVAEDGSVAATGFDAVQDGSDHDSSMHALCDSYDDGGSPSLYERMAASSDLNSDPALYCRKTYLAKYVAQTGLEIDSFQDSGWDPVEIGVLKKVMAGGKLLEDTGSYDYTRSADHSDYTFEAVTAFAADPSSDGQSNFGICDGQYIGEENRVVINIDGACHLFEVGG